MKNLSNTKAELKSVAYKKKRITLLQMDLNMSPQNEVGQEKQKYSKFPCSCSYSSGTWFNNSAK